MANVVEYRKFICVNFEDSNNNKVWNIKLYDNDDVEVEWGRVGKSLQSKPHYGGGRHKFDSLIKKKTNPRNSADKLYSENKVVEGVSSSCSPHNQNLKKIAIEQIKTQSKIVRDLIEYLTKINAHNILVATNGSIEFDTSTAQFKTPQGIIVPEQVHIARQLLADMSDFVRAQDWQDTTFRRNLNEYLRLIPHDVGMKKIDPKNIIPSVEVLQRENDILDGLETSLIDVTTQPKKDKAEVVIPKIFDVEVDLVENQKIFDKINKWCNNTRKGVHSCSHLRLAQLYSVRINGMKKRFEEVSSKMGNVRELFHGTSDQNLLSILKNGLKINPPRTVKITGKCFGCGAYFASSSSKSLNYSYGYWGGTRKNRCYMLVADVCLGNYYVPDSGWGSFPKSGYDSTWAKAGVSGVINDEFIVYKENQCNLTYLLEFN